MNTLYYIALHRSTSKGQRRARPAPLSTFRKLLKNNPKTSHRTRPPCPRREKTLVCFEYPPSVLSTHRTLSCPDEAWDLIALVVSLARTIVAPGLELGIKDLVDGLWMVKRYRAHVSFVSESLLQSCLIALLQAAPALPKH